jgi:hypothetical protein
LTRRLGGGRRSCRRENALFATAKKWRASDNGWLASQFHPCHAHSVVYEIAGVSGSFIRPTKLTSTSFSARHNGGFVRTPPCPPKKFNFSPGHGHGRPENLIFHLATAVAGRKKQFFDRTRLWQGEKTVIFTKNAHFPPKHKQ